MFKFLRKRVSSEVQVQKKPLHGYKKIQIIALIISIVALLLNILAYTTVTVF